MGRKPETENRESTFRTQVVWWGLTVAAALVGAMILLDTLDRSSATYDEVAYLRVAARWYRTGDQDEITRMGSPLTFWKLQQAPLLWAIDRLGGGAMIDDPIRHQETLLPMVRVGGCWLWAAAFGLTVWWARGLYGYRAMALAAWMFALSPNLVAHCGLATMELPLMACTTAMFLLFSRFLTSGRQLAFLGSAAAGGLAFSCKFTTALIPPILAAVWWIHGCRRGTSGVWRLTFDVGRGMVAYLLIMLLSNLVVTGFAVLPLSQSNGEHPSIAGRFGDRLAPVIAGFYETPLPRDWTGFLTQMHHQMSGGSSYLFGERRMQGWSHYYLVALAVKLPLGCLLALAGRSLLAFRYDRAPGRAGDENDLFLVLSIVLFLAVASLGSSRNYGLRYLLPLTPLAIVWVSRLAEAVRDASGRVVSWPRRLAMLCLAGQAFAVVSSHPFELTYFNELAGGPIGGRRILSDSNFDWGQGLKGLARLQRREPEFRDLTFYYFGDTDPSWYGVEGISHVVNAVDDHSALPSTRGVTTRYLAVSASLQWGPWGPPGFFDDLKVIVPERLSEDKTIAIYRTTDLMESLAVASGEAASRTRVGSAMPIRSKQERRR